MKCLQLILAILLLSSIGSNGQTKQIDEQYDDWNASDLALTDASGDGNGIDFTKWYMSDDTENIYLYIDMGQEIELQEKEGLRLYIDIDNNSSTGITSSLHRGADVMYDFGDRRGYYYDGNNFNDIFHNDFNLVSLPTVSSSEFEISFSKTIDYFNGSLTLGSVINLSFYDSESSQGDRIPDSGWLTYTMSNSPSEHVAYALDKSAEADLRIVSYNVKFDGIFDPSKAPAFERILAASNPDIICFQEIYDHSANDVLQLMNDFVPDGNATWYTDRIGPDIIVASRYPIINSVQSDGNGIFEVDVDGTIIIIVNAHLPCCNNDTERQEEVDRLMAFIRNAQALSTLIPIEMNTPIFIMGDMNFVGLQQQRHTLQTGDIVRNSLFGPDFVPDWDGTSFDMATPFMTGSSSAVTWYNGSGSFSAGRLDYFLYTGSVAEVVNTYALNTSSLTESERLTNNLLSTDTERASDHFPLIADVKIDAISRTTETNNFRTAPYPNPTNDHIIVPLSDPTSKISVCAVDGKQLENDISTNGIEGQEMKIHVGNLPPGIYILRVIDSDGNVVNHRFLKH